MVHGEYDSQKHFKKYLKDIGFKQVEIPELGEEYELN